MVDAERFIDLKEEKEEANILKQYVDLRNSHCDLLLTRPVTVSETKEWLQRNDIEIRAILREHELIGAVILYLDRMGEIAFFVKYRQSGLGSRLLKIIESAARERGLYDVWAWVLIDNASAQKTFLNNGYQSLGKSSKKYLDAERVGICFFKKL